jgi:hypothetical protein
MRAYRRRHVRAICGCRFFRGFRLGGARASHARWLHLPRRCATQQVLSKNNALTVGTRSLFCSLIKKCHFPECRRFAGECRFPSEDNGWSVTNSNWNGAFFKMRFLYLHLKSCLTAIYFSYFYFLRL